MPHRRQFTAAFKAQVVLEWCSGAKSSAALWRAHQLASSVLREGQAQFLAHAASLVQGADPRDHPDATRVAELARLVGRLPSENAI